MIFLATLVCAATALAQGGPGGQPRPSFTLSSATRAPGKYSLKLDGKDNNGKPVVCFVT